VSEILVEPTENVPARFAIWSISPGYRASSRALATLKGFLPLPRLHFERRLTLTLEQAVKTPGFFLGNFAARRALGADLVIDVDPARLKKRMKKRSTDCGTGVYLEDKFLGSGQWQPMLQPISASATHRDVQEVIRVGFDYQRTGAYRYALKKAGGSHPVRRNFVALKTPELVDRYFRHVVELCQSIRERGVARRAAFRQTAKAFKNLAVRLPWVELTEGDIGVAIGPGGALHHFGSGKHRLAAAQALSLESVPVEVRLVHVAWLQRQIDTGGQAPLSALLRGVQSLDQR
jgi:hypothetical protein